ncbi:MAG: peptide deformylase [Candidatus Daviesbacteria bacterium]|nr:peptide deformylase [Candidatus Daviesbacteria bacterium]
MPHQIKDYFVKPSDPILKNIAKPIPQEKIHLPKTKQIIKKMLSIAYGEQMDKSKPFLVGVAAPQLGISERIVLVDRLADGKGKAGDLNVYINPEITWKSEEEWEWYEGCYSADRVCGIVSRPIAIKIKAHDQNGNIIEEDFEYYTARIFQHEIDHLNGHEFVELVLTQNPNNLHWVEDKEFMNYRNNEAWRNWPKKCSREKWEKIKGIK